MKKNLTKLVFGIIFIVPLLLSSNLSIAQDGMAGYEEAKAEIEKQFGQFPTFFDAYPKHGLASAWANYQQMNSPENNIPNKYVELIRLAVASQIPCVYCVYFHRVAAKAAGATDEEIKEAVAHGAQTRHWSMVTQGSGISFEEFKAEMDAMMEFMSQDADKK